MTGHSPAATVAAVQQQVARGITLMLPSEDSISVGEELQRRFDLPFWQFALTATDANRFSIRLARQITRRPKILVFNWCYHGSVDETFITLENGTSKARRGNTGPPVDPSITTKVIEFNDVAALEWALQPWDVACVLAEPALTNVGIVLPDPGYHHELRELTRKYGTLLIIDETHTICAGPGGYTRAENLNRSAAEFRERLTDSRRRLRRPLPCARTLRTATPAAWAELLPATRCRLLPCAPLWKRFLRKRRLIT
jgi:glutamate-1-semialdehyde 2,1-aminomutase